MKHLIQKGSVLFASFLMPALSHADLLGLHASAGVWSGSYSGTILDEDITLDGELGFDDTTSNVLSLAFEHPIPFIPNFRLQSTEIDATSVAELGEDSTIGEISDSVETVIDFSHTDFTIYYELLDNVVSLDLGLSLRRFDGVVTITNTSPDGDETVVVDDDFTGNLPMLYGRAEVAVPLTGFSAGLTMNTVDIDGNSLTDFSAGISYMKSLVALEVGAELGFRSMTAEIDDDDLTDIPLDAEVSGPYLNIKVHF